MKFAATLLALALGALATLQQRDADGIKKVLGDIGTQVQALDTAVTGFSGDSKGLLSAGATLLSTLKSGTSTVAGSDQLDILSASQVAQSVTGLNSTVAQTVSDLIAAKSKIIAAGIGGDVLKNLQDQKVASAALADAVVSKVPTTLAPVAKQLSQGVDDSLSSAIAAYQGATNSSPAGGSSSAASGSSSAAASASHGASAGHASSSASSASASATSASSSAAASKPSSSAAGTGSAASPSKTSGAPAGTAATTKPASFTGAAVVNGVSGALAAIAVVMAL